MFFSLNYWQPGRLSEVQGMGWYLEEANLAQVSVNLLDYHQAGMHTAFEECVKDAKVYTLYIIFKMLLSMIVRQGIFLSQSHYPSVFNGYWPNLSYGNTTKCWYLRRLTCEGLTCHPQGTCSKDLTWYGNQWGYKLKILFCGPQFGLNIVFCQNWAIAENIHTHPLECHLKFWGHGLGGGGGRGWEGGGAVSKVKKIVLKLITGISEGIVRGWEGGGGSDQKDLLWGRYGYFQKHIIQIVTSYSTL